MNTLPCNWWQEDGITVDIYNSLRRREAILGNSTGDMRVLSRNERACLIDFIVWSANKGLAQEPPLHRHRALNSLATHLAVYVLDCALEVWRPGISPGIRNPRVYTVSSCGCVCIDSFLIASVCLRLAAKYEDVEANVPKLSVLLNLISRWIELYNLWKASGAPINSSLSQLGDGSGTSLLKPGSSAGFVVPEQIGNISWHHRSMTSYYRRLIMFEAFVLKVMDWRLTYVSPPLITPFLLKGALGSEDFTSVGEGNSHMGVEFGGLLMDQTVAQDNRSGNTWAGNPYEPSSSQAEFRTPEPGNLIPFHPNQSGYQMYNSGFNQSSAILGHAAKGGLPVSDVSAMHHEDRLALAQVETPPPEPPYRLEDKDRLEEIMSTMVDRLTELTLKDFAFCRGFKSSLIASSAIAVARHLLNLSPVWTENLLCISDYSLEELGNCVSKLMRRAQLDYASGGDSARFWNGILPQPGQCLSQPFPFSVSQKLKTARDVAYHAPPMKVNPHSRAPADTSGYRQHSDTGCGYHGKSMILKRQIGVNEEVKISEEHGGDVKRARWIAEVPATTANSSATSSVVQAIPPKRLIFKVVQGGGTSSQPERTVPTSTRLHQGPSFNQHGANNLSTDRLPYGSQALRLVSAATTTVPRSSADILVLTSSCPSGFLVAPSYFTHQPPPSQLQAPPSEPCPPPNLYQNLSGNHSSYLNGTSQGMVDTSSTSQEQSLGLPESGQSTFGAHQQTTASYLSLLPPHCLPFLLAPYSMLAIPACPPTNPPPMVPVGSSGSGLGGNPGLASAETGSAQLFTAATIPRVNPMPFSELEHLLTLQQNSFSASQANLSEH